MARRDLRQVSFADGLVNQRAGRNSWMDEIDKLIDWSAVVKLLDGIYGSDEGRPSYPLLTYVKLLLLQQWYGLSDPGLEEAVTIGCPFAASPVCRWTRVCPTIRRSGASARSWRRTDWPRRCSRRSTSSSMPAG